MRAPGTPRDSRGRCYERELGPPLEPVLDALDPAGGVAGMLPGLSDHREDELGYLRTSGSYEASRVYHALTRECIRALNGGEGDRSSSWTMCSGRIERRWTSCPTWQNVSTARGSCWSSPTGGSMLPSFEWLEQLADRRRGEHPEPEPPLAGRPGVSWAACRPGPLAGCLR